MSNLEEGLSAYEDSEFGKAFQILMPLAESGNPQAQKFIAYMYDFGQGVDPNWDKAIKWYRLPAQEGDPFAQNNLATLLLDEFPEEAIQWYILSGNQGCPFAIEVLADIYSGHLSILGMTEHQYRDDLKAISLYMKTAQNGSQSGCHRLGEMYAAGQGVSQDFNQAVFWYRKAAEKNYKSSQKVLATAYQQGLLCLPQDEELARYWLERSQKS